MTTFRPNMSLLWYVFIALTLSVVFISIQRYELLSVPTVLLIASLRSYFGKKIVLDGGKMIIYNGSTVDENVNIETQSITRILFKRMAVEIVDQSGTLIKIDIGWYSGHQMDRMLSIIGCDAPSSMRSA